MINLDEIAKERDEALEEVERLVALLSEVLAVEDLHESDSCEPVDDPAWCGCRVKRWRAEADLKGGE